MININDIIEIDDKKKKIKKEIYRKIYDQFSSKLPRRRSDFTNCKFANCSNSDSVGLGNFSCCKMDHKIKMEEVEGGSDKIFYFKIF